MSDVALGNEEASSRWTGSESSSWMVRTDLRPEELPRNTRNTTQVFLAVIKLGVDVCQACVVEGQ
jgi:hypothetical protein